MSTAIISTRERSALAECEEIIERGLTSFIEVGNALLRIRNEKLYREQFGSFQEYCEEKWQMSRIHAHRMIDAAEVAGNLSDNLLETGEEVLPIGNTFPKSESQLRPLAPLEPEQQREAWKEASDTAKTPGQPTAREVAAAVDKVTSSNKTERIYYRPSNGMEYAGMAISSLSKIWPNDIEREAAFERVIRWLVKQGADVEAYLRQIKGGLPQ